MKPRKIDKRKDTVFASFHMSKSKEKRKTGKKRNTETTYSLSYTNRATGEIDKKEW